MYLLLEFINDISEMFTESILSKDIILPKFRLKFET